MNPHFPIRVLYNDGPKPFDMTHNHTAENMLHFTEAREKRVLAHIERIRPWVDKYNRKSFIEKLREGD